MHLQRKPAVSFWSLLLLVLFGESWGILAQRGCESLRVGFLMGERDLCPNERHWFNVFQKAAFQVSILRKESSGFSFLVTGNKCGILYSPSQHHKREQAASAHTVTVSAFPSQQGGGGVWSAVLLRLQTAAWKVLLSHNTEELYADDQEELIMRQCMAWEAKIPLTHR